MSENKSSLIGALWLFSSLVLVGLFVSAAAQNGLTSDHMLLTFVILGLAVAGTLGLMFGVDFGDEQTKTKRQRIESMLDDLSAEERAELKQRLAEDDAILDYVDDDGELVLR